MGVYTNTQGWYSKILVTARSPKISFPILTFRDFGDFGNFGDFEKQKNEMGAFKCPGKLVKYSGHGQNKF